MVFENVFEKKKKKKTGDFSVGIALFRGPLQVVIKGIISVLLSGNAVKEAGKQENQS